MSKSEPIGMATLVCHYDFVMGSVEGLLGLRTALAPTSSNR